MNYKNLIVAVLLVAACAFTAGCTNQDQNTNTEATNSTTEEKTVEEKAVTAELVINNGSEEKTTKVEVSGEMTALEVLQKGAEELGVELQTKEYDYGTMVEGIGSDIGGTDGKYWMFYVNGEMPVVGVDAQKVVADDKVEFKYEASTF
ncbi:MAG: DUF4430 domain-containing protein [Parcubacteria group bacterium]|nr:DUF4430 domain-containing protein [Parcubacteria group bacterium]